MRMQSPASSGLLPASYSRRRRNRPNESLVGGAGTGSGNSAGGGGGAAPSYYHHQNEPPPTTYDDGGRDNTGLGPRRTLSARKPLYALASYDDGKKSSDDSDENDENDRQRGGNVRMDCAYERGYEDVLDKPLKLSDFLINDRCYQRYIMEGKRASYRGINGRTSAISSDKGFMDPAFLARICAGASFVGMLFLIWVAIMMETQPLFIKGVSVKPIAGDDGTYRFRKETSNALKAAAAYFLTMVFSLIYLQARDMNLETTHPAVGRICHLRRMIATTYFRYRRRHYDDIPDSFSGSGSHGSVLPMHVGNGGDKIKRRRKRRPRRKDGAAGGGGVGGGAVEGVLGKIRSCGIGGSKRSGRKKDR